MKIDFSNLEEFKKNLPPDITEECFRFLTLHFSVPKALYVIGQAQLEKGNINVKNWCAALGMAGPRDDNVLSFNIFNGVNDKDVFASNINLEIPVIIAECRYRKRKKELFRMIIDGNKRLRRAFLDGRETIPAYFIPWDLTKQFVEGLS